MLLNAEQILAARDKKTKIVPAPELGEGAEVLVGSMGALARAEMDDWLQTLGHVPEPPEPAEDEVVTCDTEPPPEPEPGDREFSLTENTAVMVRWAAECILDPETHRPAFGAERVAELGQKHSGFLLRVYEAAIEVNLATEAAAEAFEKNSEGTAGKDSGGK